MPCLCTGGSLRKARGVLHEGFGRAKAHSGRDETDRAQHGVGCGEPSLDLEGKHRARPAHLPTDEALRVSARDARVIDLYHLVMLVEAPCEVCGGGLCLAHTNAESR